MLIQFWNRFLSSITFFNEKRAPKNDSKKGDPLDSNRGLWPWPGAPWQPPSRAPRISEQETIVWARNNNSCSSDLTRSGPRPGEFLNRRCVNGRKSNYNCKCANPFARNPPESIVGNRPVPKKAWIFWGWSKFLDTIARRFTFVCKVITLWVQIWSEWDLVKTSL